MVRVAKHLRPATRALRSVAGLRSRRGHSAGVHAWSPVKRILPFVLNSSRKPRRLTGSLVAWIPRDMRSHQRPRSPAPPHSAVTQRPYSPARAPSAPCPRAASRTPTWTTSTPICRAGDRHRQRAAPGRDRGLRQAGAGPQGALPAPRRTGPARVGKPRLRKPHGPSGVAPVVRRRLAPVRARAAGATGRAEAPCARPVAPAALACVTARPTPTP